MTAALEALGVTKRFGEFAAIDDVSLSFEPGRIHAIVGQNGAGKTTFSRLICGLYEPTEGEIRLGDSPLKAGDIRSARAQGVDMVHQNFSLPPSFTVAEALELFDRGSTPIKSQRAMRAKWKSALSRRGSDIDVRKRVRDLSVEARQSLEIIRALEGHPSVLILDEPTAVLAPPEVDVLFSQVRALRDSGLTILIILHKLAEVFAVADTVSVLREGKVTLASTPIAELDHKTVASHIIGPDAVRPEVVEAPIDEVEAREADVALQLRDVSAAPGLADRALDGLSLTVRPGEILGIAGVEGNGQETLFDVMSGMQSPTAGSVLLLGQDSSRASVLERRRRGMRAVPSDRNSQGISLTTSLWENIALSDLLIDGRRWVVPSRRRRVAVDKLTTWSVKYRTPEQNAGELSGGNVQRVILARELGEGARVVLASNPTRGLDLGATAFVRANLEALARDGVAVVLISADLDEVRELSHRVSVLRGGRIVADFAAGAAASEIGAAMVGGTHA